jgi:outer membrane protein OmpA-like peptidoglycan-associated protein
MRLVPLFLLFLIINGASAQENPASEGENIIPNPSFELFSAPPIGWFYKGIHYTSVMKYWSSPTNASPDIYGPKVRVPSHWAEKGFGNQIPHSGLSMSGITVYGCSEGKPHCREYLQIQLSEPLVVGQDYYFEMYINHLTNSLRVSNIGFSVTKERYNEPSDICLPLKPQHYVKDVLNGAEKEWIKVSGRIKATADAEYLIIGNFFPDEATKTSKISPDALPFAYYYVDDVLLKKVPPILPVPVQDDDLTRVKLEEGKVVQLKDIYFEHDKSELMPRSYVELRKLLKVMQDNPGLVIEVCGHTDDTGRPAYNQILSEKRAISVINFLISNGVEASRTKSRGCGSTKPIAPNKTEKGRQMNRRVEFLVLQIH